MTIEELQQLTLSIKNGEYVPLLNDLLNGKSIIVGTNWIEEHDKRMIEKACKWIKYNITVSLLEDEIPDFIEDFRKAMES